MSNYKLIEVVKTSEKENQSFYDKEDLTVALADMYNDYGVAVKDDATLSVYCIVVNQLTGERMGGLYWNISTPTDENPVDISIRQRVYTHNDYADDNLIPYDSERLATGNYNTKISSSMKKLSCNFALTIRLDGKGEFADFNAWHRPTEPVIPTEE